MSHFSLMLVAIFAMLASHVDAFRMAKKVGVQEEVLDSADSTLAQSTLTLINNERKKRNVAALRNTGGVLQNVANWMKDRSPPGSYQHAGECGRAASQGYKGLCGTAVIGQAAGARAINAFKAGANRSPHWNAGFMNSTWKVLAIGSKSGFSCFMFGNK